MAPVHTVGCITVEESRGEGQAVFEQAAKKPVSLPQGNSSYMVVVL